MCFHRDRTFEQALNPRSAQSYAEQLLKLENVGAWYGRKFDPKDNSETEIQQRLKNFQNPKPKLVAHQNQNFIDQHATNPLGSSRGYSSGNIGNSQPTSP
jgi:hypothetical protein